MWVAHFPSFAQPWKSGEAKQGAATVELPVTAEQRELLLRSIRRDTEWLSKRNLMDYSLLVAIREEPVGPAGGSGPSVMAQRPLVHRGPNGNDIAVYVSIIDFLQKWDVAKRAARCIKVLESRKARGFTERDTDTNNERKTYQTRTQTQTLRQCQGWNHRGVRWGTTFEDALSSLAIIFI